MSAHSWPPDSEEDGDRDMEGDGLADFTETYEIEGVAITITGKWPKGYRPRPEPAVTFRWEIIPDGTPIEELFPGARRRDGER